MAVLKDKLVYSVDENGKRFPCGVVISDTEFINNEDFTFVEDSAGDEIIMVFPINAGNDAFCNEFAEQLGK